LIKIHARLRGIRHCKSLRSIKRTSRQLRRESRLCINLEIISIREERQFKVSCASQLYLSDYTKVVVIVPRTPASIEVESVTVNSLDSVGGQTLSDLGDLIMPMDEGWFFSQDFDFDEGLIQW